MSGCVPIAREIGTKSSERKITPAEERAQQHLRRGSRQGAQHHD
jgi:hypothetical protein